jgi:hypothetical protein
VDRIEVRGLEVRVNLVAGRVVRTCASAGVTRRIVKRGSE